MFRHCRPGPFRLSRSAVIALPFALAAFPLVFTVQEQIITTITIGPLDLTISAEGLRRFLTIMIGSWLSVQVALLLAFTTPFHDLIDALRDPPAPHPGFDHLVHVPLHRRPDR